MLECATDMLVKLTGIIPQLLAIYVAFDVTALLLFRSN